MGISTEQWRITIGCFSQPFKSIDRLKTIKIRYTVFTSLGVRTLMFILLVVQGVEANPCPPRGRGRISKGASGFGPPSGRGAGSADYFFDNPDITLLCRSKRLHTELSTNRQSSLNAWLTTSQSMQDQTRQDPNSQANINKEDNTDFAPKPPVNIVVNPK